MVSDIFSTVDRTESAVCTYHPRRIQVTASSFRLSWSRERMESASKYWSNADLAAATDPFGSAMSPDEIDQQILARVVSGETEALGELFDRHASVMLGVAYRVLGNRADAEDLVHDVFVEASRKAATYDANRARVRSWLLMRVRSRSIDRLRSIDVARRAKMIHFSTQACVDSRPRSFPQEVDADARRARLAIATLPPEQITIIELAYFKGLPLSSIADAIGIPLGTVKSRLSAALKTLRRQLSAEPNPSTTKRPVES